MGIKLRKSKDEREAAKMAKKERKIIFEDLEETEDQEENKITEGEDIDERAEEPSSEADEAISRPRKFYKQVFAFIVCISGFTTAITGELLIGSVMSRLWGKFNADIDILISKGTFTMNRVNEYGQLWEMHDNELTLMQNEAVIYGGMILIGALLTLVTFIYLLVTTGRKNEKGETIIHPLDKIFSELQIIAIGLCLGFGITLTIEVGYSYNYSGNIFYMILIIAAMAGCILLISAVGLWFVLSCVRKLKAKAFIKESIIGKFGNVIWQSVKKVYYGGSLLQKTVLGALIICICCAISPLAPFVFIVLVILATKYVNKFEEIKKGMNEVRNGNVRYKIAVESGSVGELDNLARGINQISDASNKAIQNELKNQRLKTDLISNVSHDLKTPLTSMITYVDLLKTEGLHSENAPKYLDVLDQKTHRLRKLTEDLFDAAKASSGAIPVRLEKVEVMSLVNQALGEMSDRTEGSGLVFKITSSVEKYYVHADRQLLWRVLENLIGNTAKYAQEGSRVYINVLEHTGKKTGRSYMVLEMKNISSAELNIPADELMERFKRGDEARTTEGSGLGLAIAKDLMRLQKGSFEIKIDGDLFKAILTLNSYLEEEPVSNKACSTEKVTEPAV